MPSYPESGIKLVAETDDFNSVMDEAISKAQEFDSIGDLSMSVSVDVDTTDAQTALDDLPQDETITDTVDIETNDTSKKTLESINTLKNLKVMETVWNVTGTAVDIFKQFSSFALNPLMQLDTAVARVNATTGNAIPNARELIRDIFYSDLGESIDQVGKLVTVAQSLGLPAKEATVAALTFTKTFSDQDSIAAVTTFGTLLNTNLVGNMQEAADLMTVFFQQGGNKGGDALQVINANAQSWKDMGLSASQAFSTISSLLKGNVDSASDAAKMMQTLDDSLTAAAANASSPQAQLLEQMGLKNPKDKGEAMGADFIDGFATAFANMPSDKQDLISSTFMGNKGKKFTGAIEGMTTGLDIFKNAKDQAKIAAEEIDNNLQDAINDFMLAAENAVTNWLSSSAIDLPGKITALKEGLQNALDTFAQGGTLSEALTVALKPLGFDDEFQGLESMLGNFVIALLQIVSSLQSLSPDTWQAKKGTDALIAQQGATQLAFDLKIANPDEVAMDIETATSRGLSSDKIAGVVSQTIDQLIKEGTKDSLHQAQVLVDALKTPIDQNKVPTLASGAPMNVQPVVTDEAITALQEKVDTALKQAPPPDVVDELSESMGLFAQKTADVKNKSESTNIPLKNQVDATQAIGNASKIAAPQVDNASGAIVTVTQSADASVNPLLNAAAALDAITGKANSLSAAADHVAVVQSKTSNNETTPSGPFARGVNETTGTFTTGEQGTEIITTNQDLAVLNHMTTDAIMNALSGYVPGGVVANSGNGNTYQAINNNFVQSNAQADRLGYTTAEQLRGMAGTK